ncbi:MAG: chorismate mutase, partial [Gammaproteobacteria bacterium]|nr:chorismate mutase [Gammaproteobacteria bacterium]
MNQSEAENCEGSEQDSQQGIRGDINNIDAALLDLLLQRRDASRAMAKTKRIHDLPFRDTGREQALLNRLIDEGRKRGLDAHFVTKIFNTIIHDSLRVQQHEPVQAETQSARVAMQGGTGSYSYIAAERFFSLRNDTFMHLSCKSFSAAIAKVEKGEADYAVLPIDNTTSGGINEVYDILADTSLALIGEECVPIKHCLLARAHIPVQQLQKLYAHPQAMAQCGRFIESLP